MWADNLVFYKSKSYLIFYKYWRSQKTSRLSTNLYNQVYFDCRDQFNPSMGSSDTWSDNIMVKQVNIHMYSIEVRYLLLVHIAKKSGKTDPSEMGEPFNIRKQHKIV